MPQALSVLVFDKTDHQFEILQSELEKSDIDALLSNHTSMGELIKHIQEEHCDLVILYDAEQTLSIKDLKKNPTFKIEKFLLKEIKME